MMQGIEIAFGNRKKLAVQPKRPATGKGEQQEPTQQRTNNVNSHVFPPHANNIALFINLMAHPFGGAGAKAKPGLTMCNQLMALILLSLGSFYTNTCQAADPQPYAVTLAKTGNNELDQILTDSSNLISLNETAPVGSFALVARAREDVERLTTALHSLGYYQAKANITIAGRRLDDPGIFDTIEYSPADPPLSVHIAIEPGPLFKLGKIEITGNAPESALTWLSLKPDSPARAAEVLAARETLLGRLRDEGYALAKVDEPIAKLDIDSRILHVTFHVETRQKTNLGKISITGLQRVKKDFARDQLEISQGTRYHPAAIEKARQNLHNTGVFSSVRPKTAKKLDNQGQLPVDFVVVERPLHSTSIGAAFSTDVGGSFSSNWQHRNVMGRDEQITLNAAVTQIGGNSTTGIGYNLGLSFTKPDFLLRKQSFQAGIGAQKQNYIAYDQESIIIQTGLQRVLDKHWSAAAGLALEQATVAQEQTVRDFTLFSLPLTAKYTSVNNLLDPIKGFLGTFSVTPYQPLIGDDISTFVVIQASGSTYLDLGEPGRSVLALRGLLGNIQGAGQFSLPPDKRFYAGGSATVRGYRFQSIGPQFPSGNPQGGTTIATGTVEFRQRILENYGMAAFVDAGQVSPDSQSIINNWGVGAGLGARYYTPFGPIRLDFGLPMIQHSNSGSFEIYIGLGQAF